MVTNLTGADSMDTNDLWNKILFDIEGFYIKCLIATDGDKDTAIQLFEKEVSDNIGSLSIWQRALHHLELSAKENNFESVQILRELIDDKLFNLISLQSEHEHVLH